MRFIVDEGAFVPTRAHKTDAGLDLYAMEDKTVPLKGSAVFDSGYTGSIRVKLYNNTTEHYHVRRGDKISQLVILPILTPDVEVVEEFSETDRGDNGFGSSGR